jgi:hypothetical protein
MEAWEYAEVVADHASSGRLYHEFLRVPDLSTTASLAGGW